MAAAAAAGGGGARWLLKPSLSNKGAGIALVRDAAAVAAHVAALRDVGEWVLQRYVERPLLWRGRKFHLRVYALADADLRVRVFREALCLCAALPYPGGGRGGDDDDGDLRAHITNTCVAADAPGFVEADAVHRLAELPAALAARAAAARGGATATNADADAGLAQTAALFARVCAVISQCFLALRGAPASFAPLPNAFELYGVDFLVEEQDDDDDDDGDAATAAGLRLRVLEFNPTPDIAQTGGRLEHVIGALLEEVVRTCVDSRFPPPPACADARPAGAGAPPPIPAAEAAPAMMRRLAAQYAEAWRSHRAHGAARCAPDACALVRWEEVLALPPRPGGPSGMRLT